jgi:DNA-directed RNA polymerase beta subunit
MANRVLQVLTGRSASDDRDDYMNKCLDTAGPLLAITLHQLVKKVNSNYICYTCHQLSLQGLQRH